MKIEISKLRNIMIMLCYQLRIIDEIEKEDIDFVVSNLNIQGEEIKFIFYSKDIRERASYGVDEEFDVRVAKELQEKTADFVNKVKEILNE